MKADDAVLTLSGFLKREGLASTGGAAKALIQGGEVQVNDVVETRRKRKLKVGDRVRLRGTEVVVSDDDLDDAFG